MKLLDFTIQTAKKAGALIQKESKKPLRINEKARNDLVTNVDRASEKLIIKEIKSVYPDHAIVAEESAKSKKEIENISNAEYLWIIDPLDGTTNFTHNLPQYAVSIGVFKTKSAKSSKNFDYLEGELIIGVVFAPELNELYYAEKGKGAFFNGKKIKVSKAQKVGKSLMVTGFPPTHKEINMLYFTEMINHCQAVRNLGSASLNLAYVARGCFDGYWEFGLKAWDIAAGSLIVEEAGGKATDTNGNLLDLFGQDILVSNGKIHKETVAIFKKI